MTIEEMRNKIKDECERHNEDPLYCDYNCPLRTRRNCGVSATNEEIKENYKLMFGKEEFEMENEFDFNDLKAGWAIKTLHSNELIIGIQMKNDIVFFNKNYTPIISKKNIVDKIYSENFDVLEVYGFSDDNSNLFDISTRPLFYKKEDMNFKRYKIGNLKISPNFDKEALGVKIKGYKTENEKFLFIENVNDKDEYISINKSELDELINTLTEIKDFIKGD